MPTRFEAQVPVNLEAFDDDERYQLAIDQILLSERSENGNYGYSIRNAARDFMLKRSTLMDRLKGCPPRRQANEDQKLLSASQEEVLVEWVKTMARRGMPLVARTVRDYVEDILGHSIGENWVTRFKVCLLVCI
jgi:hypothetical protein